MPRIRSIRVRLTVLIVLLSTLLLSSLALLARYASAAHFEELDRAELAAKIVTVRTILVDVAGPGDLDAARRSLATALIGYGGLRVQVARSDGSVLLAIEMPPGDTRRGPPAFHTLSETLVHPALGAISIDTAIDIRHHRAFLEALLVALFAAVGAGVPLAALLGWVVAGRALAPVRELTELAKAVSAESLGTRIGNDRVPSELTELAQAFDAMLGRLQASFSRLEEYSADLAHELRTPLNNLITETEVALSRPRTEGEYREALYGALEQCRRLARMIADMLFIARAEKGLLTPEQSAIDLRAAACKVVDYFQPLAAERNVELLVQGEATMIGDALMLERAVANLVSNAVRHARSSTTVEVAIERSADAIVMAVSNRGDTIPPAELPRLFERFHRADSGQPREGEGTGLGLAITKSIAAAHGGTASVSSAVGVTRFALRFPLAVAGTVPVHKRRHRSGSR